MKIAIDARWIFREISGIGNYTRELIRHLALIDKENSYLLLFNNAGLRGRTIKETGLDNSPNFTAKILPYGVFSILNQLLLPVALKKERVDIFHSTNYMIPVFAFPRRRKGGTGCVVTIHDVIPMIFPKHAPKAKKARLYPVYRRLMIEVGMRANAIIADSRTSKADIIKHLCIPKGLENKVKVIYCGVSACFRTKQETTSFSKLGTRNKQQRTILYVGRFDPYKNLETLIRAIAIVVKKYSLPVTLRIAGTRDPRYPEAFQLAERLGISKMLHVTGYLSDDELAAEYRNAGVLVHPSRYEGFGLQILEAMACGLPVICSNAGSLPEVAGNAAIMVDPDDPENIADKIKEVLRNPDMAGILSRRGIDQAAKFSWEKTAAETLEVYREVGKG